MGSRKRAPNAGQDRECKRGAGHPDHRTTLLIALLLVLSTATAFHGTLGNGFTNYDDYDYITKNPHVTRGLSAENLIWAFNIGHSSNWHPLTWLSHMLDCQVYGLKPWGHHLTSLVLHIANVLLLFLALSRMTGAPWRSAFVALLFGLHPLHVESVAWASERKDVLSTMFSLAAVMAYVEYVRQGKSIWYAAVLGAFVLALMSKPMAVTLPIVLLILDYWPLRRLTVESDRGEIPTLRRVIIEKAPLFALSAGSAVITIVAQNRGGSISGLELIGFGARVANAALAYMEYLYLTVWPTGLAAHYPYMTDFPVWRVAGVTALIAGISAAAVLTRKRYPYILAGWLWYVLALLPVIGLVQVGSQSFADRYTYLPLVGIFIAATWLILDLAGRILRPQALAAAAAAACILLACLTAAQVGVWKSSLTLWRHTVKVEPKDWFARYNLGSILEEMERTDEAIACYESAAAIAPNFRDAHFNLANLLQQRGDIERALDEYEEVVRIDPTDAQAHNNLCCILGKLRRFDESIEHGRTAVRYSPDYAEAHRNLTISLCLKGLYEQALEEARECERLGQPMPDPIVRGINRALEDRRYAGQQ